MKTNTTHVMLDLETWGTGYRALIVSIGACTFDLAHTFKINIHPENAQKAGLRIDAATVKWWLSQSKEAVEKSFEDPTTLQIALLNFSKWLGQFDPVALWGNGSNFDNRVLREAYEAIGIKPPWSFRTDRDMRTWKDLFGTAAIERKGTHHDALDDAIHQVEQMKATAPDDLMWMFE